MAFGRRARLITKKSSCVEYAAFLYLGPRGSDLSSLKPGSLDDDDANFDISRKRGNAATKAHKKMKFDIVAEPSRIEEKKNGKESIAAELAAHTKMASMRLVMQYDNAPHMKKVQEEVMNSLLPPTVSLCPE